MPGQYNGIPANLPSPPTAINIASSTNANPIVVTTSGPHNRTTGDTVEIKDHTVNTTANGQWPVTVLSVSTFSIPTSGVGVGGATGTVLPLTFGASFQVMADGDPLDATHLNPAPQANGDRAAALYIATGNPKLAQFFTQPQTDTNIISALPVLNFWTVTIAATGVWTNANQSLCTLHGIQQFDSVEVDFSCYVTSAGFSGASQFLSIAFASYAPGVAPPAPARIGGAGIDMGQLTSTSVVPLSMRAFLHDPINVRTGSLDLWLQGASATGGGTGTISIAKESTLTVKVWRAVNVNQ